MNRILATISLLAATFFITACSAVLTSEQAPEQIYLLEPLSATVSETGSVPRPSLTLSVNAVPGLDTDRIQAINLDSRLNQYANAHWADHLPEVLSSVLRRSLVSSGQFNAVRTGRSPDPPDWTLALEIQKFYGVLNSAGSTAEIAAELEGLLQCNDEQHAVQLSSSIPVHEERLSVVVKAHQQALDGITQQLLKEITKNCQ